ncbi:MAG: NADP-dependent isocitrate dehydrogenase [Myxococcales bacterium]|nr:NADP-dependent isocitrate dehydrogenase [Myxococcales bacterium]
MTPRFAKLTPPAGEAIAYGPAGIRVPTRPIVPFIRGDGIGPEIWEATRAAVEAAVAQAYGDGRALVWFEVYAGAAAAAVYGPNVVLPDDSLAAIRHYKAAIKGPVETPVGGGIRSVNVALRQALDLYANVRPVRYLPGLPSPLKAPEKVDLVIFRENTEDVYAGIEWAAGSPEAQALIAHLNQHYLAGREPLSPEAAIGLKPMTRRACERLVRRAVAFALAAGYPSVTLVHKGNIMKFTEGGFVEWGYELARAEFGERTLTRAELTGALPSGKVLIKDRIADAMFQDLILHPEEHAVVATTNLNGDYLSDAAAALVGGLGFAAGANLGDELAVFEAVHGTAPDLACRDVANPSSLILTAYELLRHLGWTEAAELLLGALRTVIGKGWVTADVACWLPNVVPLSCSEFAASVVEEIRAAGA